VAAELVAEDLVLLTQDSDRKYRMSAACVCFPSAWSISEKLGRSVWEIHEPVNSLNKNIGVKIDELLLNLKPDKPLTRINFLVNFDPLLSQIPETMSAAEKFPRPSLTPETIGRTLWLRNERETLKKLPKSGDIIFTLKTYQTLLDDLPKSTLETILKLHENLDPEYRERYRKLTPDEHQMLLKYCRKRLAE
jgi:hypothetical protein